MKNARSKALADLLDTLYEGEEVDNEDEPAVLVEDDTDNTTSLLRQILESFIASLQKLTSKEAVDKVCVHEIVRWKQNENDVQNVNIWLVAENGKNLFSEEQTAYVP